MGLNISAVGRELEEGLPITFTNSAMVLFVRWLAQVYGRRPFHWCRFRCHFIWSELGGGELKDWVVAEGSFGPFVQQPLSLGVGQAGVNRETA